MLLNNTLLFPPSPNNPTSSPEEHDEEETSINISDAEWNTIRPYIDEEELRALDPRVRLHIVYSALACNLDGKEQVFGEHGTGNKIA